RSAELDPELLADQQTAALEDLVPRQAPILAVHVGPGREADALVAPRAGLAALELSVEHDGVGHAVHGKVPGHVPSALSGALHLGALERDLGEVLGVEEVGV